LLKFNTILPNPLIQTYVAFCKSCWSIAPLQLLVLEIFEYVDTFLRYAISKVATAILNRSRHRHSRVPVLQSTTPSCRPRAVQAQLQRMVARCGPKRGLGGSAHLLCRAKLSRGGLLAGPAWPRAAVSVHMQHACGPPAGLRGLKASAAPSSTSSRACAAKTRSRSSAVAWLIPGVTASLPLGPRAGRPHTTSAGQPSPLPPQVPLLLSLHHRTVAGPPDGAIAGRLRRTGPSRAGASTR
jgi:hypothetical protein